MPKPLPRKLCVTAVHTFIISSPIGDMEIISCSSGLHSVKQCDKDDSSFTPIPYEAVELKHQDVPVETCRPAEDCVNWLKQYFTLRVASTDIPNLCESVVKEGSFRARAWKLLPQAVPFGSSISYLQLAQLCGNGQASRAAGQAMATNPISLLVPCHRVVRTQGGPGNYSHGKKNSMKVWLLNFEKGRKEYLTKQQMNDYKKWFQSVG